MRHSIGIDVGGTFTDLVAVSLDDGTARSGKVLSTPHDQSQGVEEALQAQGPPAPRVARIVHGTTVVTNMLLERRGARVALCATRGATDLLELRRQERASLYDLAACHPPPLVDAAHVVAVHERLVPGGVEDPLTPAEAANVAEQVAALDPEIVAIALLHAYADPVHELRLAEAIAARLPAVDIVCSSDVLPEIREFERTATTTCEAYARPGVRRYLENLTTRVAALGMPAPGVVSSSGGMRDARDAARHAASLALSGPAGGVAGAALVTRLAGFDRALRFYALGLRFEGNREWNFQLRGMSDRQLLAAARWACAEQVLDRCVNTADRTRDEHDFALRFVSPFLDRMKPVAAGADLDPAWVYGLIRQESRFVRDARSWAGAQGLMQIMPATARWIAKKLGERDFRVEQLHDLDTNLRFGTFYLRSVLDDLEGSPLLASAAYNAGPGRPRSWRSTLSTPVEGAIFAEIIPFNETRDYVKKVLTNAVYYAALFTGQPQSLKARLGRVAPALSMPTDIP